MQGRTSPASRRSPDHLERPIQACARESVSPACLSKTCNTSASVVRQWPKDKLPSVATDDMLWLLHALYAVGAFGGCLRNGRAAMVQYRVPGKFRMAVSQCLKQDGSLAMPICLTLPSPFARLCRLGLRVLVPCKYAWSDCTK